VRSSEVLITDEIAAALRELILMLLDPDCPHAVRILARAWLHINWRCWHDNTTYNPAQRRALQKLLNQDTGQLTPRRHALVVP
jgi:hypothetical protein